MQEEITVLEILNRLEQKVSAVKSAVETGDLDKLREEAACSLICGDEAIVDKPVLSADLDFTYKGHLFMLNSCNDITRTEQIMGLNSKEDVRQRFPRGIFTDRYVCWMQGSKDIEGMTLSEYLEKNPDETEENNCWAPDIYLVPKAWAYGAEFDLKPGAPVEQLILYEINQFLEQNPDL